MGIGARGGWLSCTFVVQKMVQYRTYTVY